MKKKIILLSYLLIISVAILTACNSNNPIVGRWEYNGLILEFNRNGTGIEFFDEQGRSQMANFTWDTNGNILDMHYPAEIINTPILNILTTVIHGQIIGRFEFEITSDGNTLWLFDDHGHSHFRLDFRKIN